MKSITIEKKELIRFLEFGLLGIDECKEWTPVKEIKQDRIKDLEDLNLLLDKIESDKTVLIKLIK